MPADGYMPHDRTPIRVLLIDGHLLLADALAASINMFHGFAFDVAPDLDAALAQITAAGPYDVVLLDQGSDYLAALQALGAAGCTIVALFGAAMTWAHIDAGLAHGIAGFIPKSTRLRVLVHAIRLIADGEVYLPADYVLRASTGHGDDISLKPRELRVLAYLCEGLPNKQIAQRLSHDQGVVKLDMRNICRKLGVSNRTQAVIKAQRENLI